MRARALLSLAGAFIAAVALVSASGAATTNAQKVTKIDVSTRAAVVHYLRSIHVNPKGAAIQRGLRNYAGARCPGKGWTCAGTRHTVVQIAKRGGQNRFACGTAKCAVVQFGVSRGLKAAGRALPPPVNTASCIKTTGVTQSCTINQPNATGTNKAVVWMDTGKFTGLTQSAVYSASITQGPASPGTSSNLNLACVHQAVAIDGSATKTNNANVTVNDDAHQSVSIQQNSRSGNNSVQGAVKGGTTKNPTYDCDTATSSLTQTETLTSTVTTKGSITQNQDAAPNDPNVKLDIEQNQGSGFKCTTGPLNCPSSGTNTAAFTQTSTQTAIANKTTTTGSVSQTQSSPDVAQPYSGLVGTINQDSSSPSTTNATQNETQCEDALNTATDPNPLATCHSADQETPGYTLTQTQYGPEGVFKAPANGDHGPVHYAHKGYGTATLTGNSGDHITVNQTSQQDNDTFAGQFNTQEADCSTPQVPDPPGGCTVHQTTLIDGNPTSNDQSGSDLSGVGINCQPGEEGSDCTQSPPPGPICNASGDTNAAYNDMPTEVVNCLNPGIGFEATSTSEFGDEVGLAASAGRTLDALKVDFQSWACQSGHWYDGACSSAPNATFDWPITANIYAVADCSGTPCPGALLATTTQTQTIPYRPSATASCPANGAPAPAGAAWFNPMAPGGGACQNSIGKVLTFNNWTDQEGFTGTLPDTVIWTVAFNTSDYGSSPVGPADCQIGPGGCPYDSLNVGDKTYTGAPYAGTDTDPNGVFLSSTWGGAYCDGGTAGIGSLRLDTPCWTGFRPLGEILVAPASP